MSVDDPVKEPTWKTLAWYQARVQLLQLKRGVRNHLQPLPRFRRAEKAGPWALVAEHRSQLFTGITGERHLDLGKIHNLRLIARALDGLIFEPGEEFSFWRHVGRCTRFRGFSKGRQLLEGCLVPAVGGGICQVSNALYDVALQVGCRVTERHSHSRVVPGSLASQNRDATVAWNHIDLRFKSNRRLQLRISLTDQDLLVGFYSNTSESPRKAVQRLLLKGPLDPAHACGACVRTDCRLFESAADKTPERVAYLVDEYWPEFDEYIQQNRNPGDELFLPINGSIVRKSNYRWSTQGFAVVRQAPFTTLIRSFKSRNLAAQGPARQRLRLETSKALAGGYAKRLPVMASHLVVSLELLPYLYKNGALGGRTFDVLMTRHPLAELHSLLDSEFDRHPSRKLLGDFRADPKLVELESQALGLARKVITPHRDVFTGDCRRILLNWKLPMAPSVAKGRIVAFPGPTVARKGAYEVRGAVQALGLAVRPVGSELEGKDLWAGAIVPPKEGHWLSGVGVVVQPAVLENQPRKLLAAIAAGCPVVCTQACGLPEGPLVRLVENGNADELISAIASALNEI